MKSLATLIKLQKTYVDEQQIVLVRAQERLAIIERGIAELAAQKLREAEAVKMDPRNAVTYGEYLKEALKKERIFAREKQIAEAAVNAAREKLTELFEEQKRYETAEAARIEAESREQRKRETAELDEIGGVGHARNKEK